MKWAFILLFSLIYLASPANAAGAETVFFEIPQDFITQSLSWGGPSDQNFKIAAGYAPTSDQSLCSVEAYIAKSGNPIDGVSLKIYRNNQGFIFPELDDLVGQTALSAFSLSESQEIEKFSFSDCLPINAGSIYWFVFSRTQPGLGGSYVIGQSAVNYSFTLSHWTNNGSWSENQFNDFGIKLISGRSGPDRTPVLIIPGIAGTELYDENDLIWADLGQMFLDVNDEFVSESLVLNNLGLSVKPIQVGNIIESIDNEILGGIIIDIFKTILIDFKDLGFIKDFDLFIFPYDWRMDLDNSSNFLDIKIRQIKLQTGSEKVDIVTHSMGGLLVENYIDQYGKDNINKLIFVGTPHEGAPKAGKILFNGDRLNIPWLENNTVKELALNMPSIYQLLPNSDYVSNFGSYIKKENFLNFEETKNLISGLFNSSLFNQAESFWSKNLNSQDFSGIDVYNIVGCGNATQYQYKLSSDNKIKKINYTTGDETVPLGSAASLATETGKTFYAKGGRHSELPSFDGVRQLISQILIGEEINLASNISNNSSLCNLKGKTINFRSPVDVHVYDAQNRHSGPIEGGLENNIPGVDYEIIDGHKFVFLPTNDGQLYQIEGIGTASGSFDLSITDYENGTELESKIFNDVAINTDSKVRFNISNTTLDNQIELDYENDGVFSSIGLSSILDGQDIEDIDSPITNIDISGPKGLNDWYLGDVTISLTAQDSSSGILESKYSINNGPFIKYTNPFPVSLEGVNSVSFYSIDKAGNNEEIKTVQVKIDKIYSEFEIKFDTVLKNFNFDSTDPFSCLSNSCTAQDEAGNISIIKFNKLKVGNIYTLSLKSISYNGVNKDISDNVFVVNFATDKNNKITIFNQTLLIKNQEIVRIEYNPKTNSSTIYSYRNSQLVKEVMQGIKYLQTRSDGGKIIINY